MSSVLALDVRGLRKTFPGVVALDDVSFELRRGEVHALVGENGAGKSTLIKVVTGVYQPDAGEIRLMGESVSFSTPRDALAAGIATTYQEINLVRQMSVARNLSLGREPLSWGLLDIKAMSERATELLGRFGIDLDVRRPIATLGVGTQQMIAVVRAVSADARVVVLDEPTSSLEPREVERLVDMVRHLRDDGVAVVYVSHKLEEVFELCDRVTVLRDGRRVHTGQIAELNRLQLIAHMLGRDIGDVRARGVTRFDRDASIESSTPVIEAIDLSRRRVLDGVSVDVRRGEIVGLAGLLGSGRSETVKAIFGTQPVDHGEVQVDGTPVRLGSPPSSVKAGIGLLSEDRKEEGVVATLSVADNLVLGSLHRFSRFGFVSRRKVQRSADDFAERLRIKVTDTTRGISELSGGNQQKVLIARLLCSDPRVLLLDEPTRGIDVGAKAEVQGLIGDLADEGLAVILISSELEDVVEGSDRVLVFRDGAVVGTLAGDDITESAIMELVAHAAAEDPQGDVP